MSRDMASPMPFQQRGGAQRRRVGTFRFMLAADARGHVGPWLTSLLAQLGLVNGLNLVNSYVGRDFMTAVAQRDEVRYVRFAAYYLVVFLVSSVAAGAFHYTEERVRLVWREAATRKLVDRYLAHQARGAGDGTLGVDNPDQRITEDVRAFTGTSVSMVVLVCSASISSVMFLGVLWSITPRLVAAAFCYAALGSAMTIFLGRSLIGLTNVQLTREADLRYGLIRVREDRPATLGESVRDVLHGRIGALVVNTRAIIRVTLNVAAFTGLYNYLLQIIPILIVAPLYLRGQVELGVVTQSAMAFSQVMGALSMIITQYNAITSLITVTNRLDALLVTMPPES